MDVFYNLQAIGDVLIMPIEDADRYEVKHEQHGDITKIMNAKDEVVGYNIFNASTHFDVSPGKTTLTEAYLDEIKALFKKEGLDDPLDFDLSPKFVVGYVTGKEQHPDADKLSVCQVDVGTKEDLQIVCGAANVDQDQKVVVAKIGATMPSGLQIKPTELRGVPSHGMICSRAELNLPVDEAEEGIYVLDDSYEIGDAFSF